MKHLRTACVGLAFVATTVSGSAQTSLTRPERHDLSHHHTVRTRPDCEGGL